MKKLSDLEARVDSQTDKTRTKPDVKKFKQSRLVRKKRTGLEHPRPAQSLEFPKQKPVSGSLVNNNHPKSNQIEP